MPLYLTLTRLNITKKYLTIIMKIVVRDVIPCWTLMEMWFRSITCLRPLPTPSFILDVLRSTKLLCDRQCLTMSMCLEETRRMVPIMEVIRLAMIQMTPLFHLVILTLHFRQVNTPFYRGYFRIGIHYSFTAYSSSVLLSEASSPLTTPSNRSRKRKPDEADDEPGHYPCTFPNCDKVFERIHNLRSHIRTHSGDRPYACTTCGLRFSRNHDLKRHERIHQGVRPYVCDFCGKSFLRLDALNRHLKVNNGKGCRTRVKKSELLNLPPVPVRMQSEVLIESDSLLTSAMQ